ncbi:MAG TPA: ThiF family adenylyltransferase [Tepidisphaeraceae bacterium]|jgi:adenylyltransferase/sulfurtransferase|nr:ThiF family adenylyltransferase [Tepidisphaeraceae bacterium]
MGRYDRQQILPQIGPDGQERLGRARVLLVGCGALGSVVAEMLVRSGVGWVRIVDRDLVELSNLQRQVLFDESDAAQELPKAIAAAERLRKINSQVRIEPIVTDVNAANIESLAEATGLILDGTDNVATRYLINDLAVKHRIPWVYGGCVGVAGRVWGIWPRQTACLRCVFPKPPQADELPTCDTAGVLGSAAVVVGGLQAAMAIRMLVEGPQRSGELPGLISLDAWSGQFRTMASASKWVADCPCCGQGNFPFLSTNGNDFTTNLCGRHAVQVVRGPAPVKIDLSVTAEKWRKIGAVATSPWFVRCKLNDPAGIDLTLFADGRLVVHGSTEPSRARSLYARFVGS